MFDTAIQPIVTCGMVKFGVYIQKRISIIGTIHTIEHVEKTHLKFCNMFLEGNKKAANHATRAEMGRFPIQISIISLIFKDYIYLNGKESNSIVKQALNIARTRI